MNNIEIKHLTVGSIVHWHYKDFEPAAVRITEINDTELTGIHIDFGIDILLDPSDLYGIPMDDKWMRKLGFNITTSPNKEVGQKNYKSIIGALEMGGYNHGHIISTKSVISYVASCEEDLTVMSNEVHRVQLLYKAMQGKDLPIWNLLEEKEPPEDTAIDVSVKDHGIMYMWMAKDLDGDRMFTIFESDVLFDEKDIMAWKEV